MFSEPVGSDLCLLGLKPEYAPLVTGRETNYTGLVTFALLVLLVVLVGFAFWIWMLIDCVTKEPDTGNTKICWVLIIVFAHIIGALVYYLVRRDQRFAEIGR